MHDDDLHPYYIRKAKRNAEMLDVLVPFFKWAGLFILVGLVVDYAIS